MDNNNKITKKEKAIIVAVTGASGIIYAVHLIGNLLKMKKSIDLIFSDNSKFVVSRELGIEFNKENVIKYIKTKFSLKDEIDGLRIFDCNDFSAPLASGSAGYDKMVIIPCSMKTLSSVANGHSENLIERAADVILKERRRLVLVPRETPLSEIHLENMFRLSRAGGIILPAMPAFYNNPKNIDDLIYFIVERVLIILGFKQVSDIPWGRSIE